MAELPGHERRHERRLERRLDDDEPGAPPGFLLDDEDERTHDRVEIEVEADENNPLARGEGEEVG